VLAFPASVRILSPLCGIGHGGVLDIPDSAPISCILRHIEPVTYLVPPTIIIVIPPLFLPLSCINVTVLHTAHGIVMIPSLSHLSMYFNISMCVWCAENSGVACK
jgi:hypothetical protein